jgi:hypothetical protein
VQISGQFYAPAAYSPEKHPPILINQGAGSAPSRVGLWENCIVCRKSIGDSSALEALVRRLMSELVGGVTVGSY